MYQIACFDAILHTSEHPRCSDALCPCQFKVMSTSCSSVEIEDAEGYRSTVFLGGDTKWKCLRCARYRCVHAQWVTRQNLMLPPPPELSIEDFSDLIDE